MHVMSLRGGFVETSHPIRAVAVQFSPDPGGGSVVWEAGRPAHSTWRSAGKPVQAWASLEAMGDPALSAADLALGASSHSGEDRHLAGVRALMARLGVEEGWLRCGAEWPVHGPTREALVRAGGQGLPIHNDCSGKHALMLGACVRRGWSREYRPASHPLQRRITELTAAWCGEAPGLAGDGCGVPTFYLSVAGMARAWARLAAAMDGAAMGDGGRLGRIGAGMMQHPELTSGAGRIDLAVAGRVAEPFVGKIGAEGVFCMALPARRLGVALKVASGNESALAVAVPAVLAAAAPGSVRADPEWEYSALRDVEGKVVGRWVVGGRIRA